MKTIIKYKQSVIISIIFFSITVFAGCDSPVDNTDDNSTIHWTIENSPYLVTDTMVVDSGTTLIIDAGVIVKFEDYAALVVKGALKANGEKANKIIFTAIDDSFGVFHEDSWIGIKFDSCLSDQTLLKYCVIEKSVGWDGWFPVWIKDSSPTILYCTFGSFMPLWDSGGAYLHCVGYSNPLIDHNYIPPLISSFRGMGIHSLYIFSKSHDLE